MKANVVDIPEEEDDSDAGTEKKRFWDLFRKDEKDDSKDAE
jgi:hypothetical protein